ncbi:MAG: hypothetical protein IPP78_15825 [Holophagaceae bacterium]|nr:hypothetical protein [Holophagaceae bacterium]
MSHLKIVSKMALVIGITSGLVAAERWKGDPPRFEDYAASNQFLGKKAALVISKQDRMYRTRLKRGAEGNPNFAGRYILTIWGCGASCRMGAAIDTKTGRVHWLPGTVCCWDVSIEEDPKIGDPILFRQNSKLIVLSGLLNETGTNGSHYFKFENGEFIPLLTVPTPLPSVP